MYCILENPESVEHNRNFAMSHHLSKGERGQVLSLQHGRELTHLYWISSLSPKQRQGWEKWLISTSVITWLRYAQGMTHLKKPESNLQQTNYVVKSPSFSVFRECSPRILIFLGFLFIWNDLMSLFSENNLWIFRLLTAHIRGSTCSAFLPFCPKGFLLPFWVWKGCRYGKVWEQWKVCFKSRICSLWISLIKY